MAEIISGNSAEERNWRQDKLLTKQEIERLKTGEIDIHEIKNEENASKKDLYKDRDGNIYVKPKGGMSPCEPTDININDF
ncbi:MULTISPECIES: polymorphic toxin type 33 domain-containing protein [unclassified Microcoleus]|uniref:polymorphic toxin type 33 domain-containing protein n=1 Tax=unclassified Microcoleus TaxID=2642155 RepID=UPI002FD03BC7